MEQGKLTSGRSGKKVTNPRQAIAIGLSEARKAGGKVPPPRKTATKKTPAKKSAKKAGKKTPQSRRAEGPSDSNKPLP
jgi:hypothetical protein